MKLLLLPVGLRLTVIGITRFFGFSFDCICIFVSLDGVAVDVETLWPSDGKSETENFDAFPLKFLRLPPPVKKLSEKFFCVEKDEREIKRCRCGWM